MIRTYLPGYRERQLRRGPLSGENLVLLVNTSDPDAEDMLAVYQDRRGVPDGNVLRFSLSWSLSSTGTMADADMTTVMDALCDKLDALGDTARAISPLGHWPTLASRAFSSAQFVSDVSLSVALSRPYLARDNRLGVKVPSLAAEVVLPSIPQLFVDEYADGPIPTVSTPTKLSHGDPSLLYPRWKANTQYEPGDIIWTEASLFYGYALQCTIAGKSGGTEPTSVTGTFTDNTVTWSSSNTKRSTVDYKMPYSFRLPEDHYTRQKARGTDQYGEWRYRLYYPVVYLDVPEVVSGNPVYTSRLEHFTALVDACIAVEAEERVALPGKAVLQGSGSYATGMVAAAAYIELVERDFAGEIYHENLDAEQGVIATTLPSDNMPPTATSVTPVWTSGTFVPIDDVMIHALGTDAYFGKNIIASDDIGYAQGAIACFAQSCGANTPAWRNVDTVDQQLALESVENSSGTEISAIDASPGIYYIGVGGQRLLGCYFSYAGAAATASIAVPSDNQIVFREDGIVVSTLNLAGNTYREQMQEVLLAVEALSGWSVSLGCGGIESRAIRALRNGAVVAIGSPAEPGVNHMPSMTNIIAAFYTGASVAQAQMANATEGMRRISVGNQVLPLWYGDPLYCPLAGIEM